VRDPARSAGALASVRRVHEPGARRSTDDRISYISIIAPMFNETGHVDGFVADVAAQDFGGDIELLVADGGSEDGSVERLTNACQKAEVDLTVIDNPARWVSAGLNACLERARGDLIVRLDCHSRYPADYLRLCAAAAEETGAWNVGGVVLPEGITEIERAVACAMDSPFGGIGWTRQAGIGDRIEVDTVTYGAFRPEAFKRAGGFDESLVRNQDDEFNLRLRRAGGTIVLDPAIKVWYRPRGSLAKVFRQYYEYGRWKVPVMVKHRQALSGRSLAPIVFVSSLALLAVLSPRSALARRLLLAEMILYGACAVGFAAASVRKRRQPWSLLPATAATFGAFHSGYGLGMLRGWLGALRTRRRTTVDAG
jgi:succinoglycan biosynthesis protein ExoA